MLLGLQFHYIRRDKLVVERHFSGFIAKGFKAQPPG